MPASGYQGSFAEEVTELELNYNEFFLRTYDPQIGRWTTIDPYDEFASHFVGMGGDPANNVDPTGGFIGAIMGFFKNLFSSGVSQMGCWGSQGANVALTTGLIMELYSRKA